MNITFSQPSSGFYPWNTTVAGVQQYPQAAAQANPYAAPRYQQSYYPQVATNGEPLPHPFDIIQASMLATRAQYVANTTPTRTPHH